MKLKKLKGPDGIEYRSFICPGCDDLHVLPVTGPKAWGFNGNDVYPTFTPSILVTDGRIRYLSDCTHALAGQTVDLPERT